MSIEQDVKNYIIDDDVRDPPRLKAEVDNIILDLHNSSHRSTESCRIQ